MVTRIWLLAALLVPLAWLIPHLSGGSAEMGAGAHALLSGFAIVAGAFLLSWATELSERYVPPSFALIVLALISVLPEYAVDLHFAWEAGKNPEYRAYAVANMTGANRVLIGIGWTMLVFVGYLRNGEKTLAVHPHQRLELGFLLLATAFSFIFPIQGELSLWHSAVLVLIFGAYVFRALQTESEEHPLVGPAAWLAERTGDPARIATIVFFLVYACVTIWFSAEPFAESLLHVGNAWGVDEFLLIQLVAPLASESPEFIVAILFVLRGRASTALGALVSSKVNQWTLLVGAIPVAYSISSGEAKSMVLEARPQEELLLTSAQSLFAVVLLADLSFTLFEAILLLVLFLAPWFFPQPGVHYIFSGIYFLLVIVMGFSKPEKRRALGRLLRLRS